MGKEGENLAKENDGKRRRKRRREKEGIGLRTTLKAMDTDGERLKTVFLNGQLLIYYEENLPHIIITKN